MDHERTARIIHRSSVEEVSADRESYIKVTYEHMTGGIWICEESESQLPIPIKITMIHEYDGDDYDRWWMEFSKNSSKVVQFPNRVIIVANKFGMGLWMRHYSLFIPSSREDEEQEHKFR